SLLQVAQGSTGSPPGKGGPAASRPSAGPKEPSVLPAVFSQQGDSLPVDPPVGPGSEPRTPVRATPTGGQKEDVAAFPGVNLPEVSPPPVPAARPVEDVPNPVAPPSAPGAPARVPAGPEARSPGTVAPVPGAVAPPPAPEGSNLKKPSGIPGND